MQMQKQLLAWDSVSSGKQNKSSYRLSDTLCNMQTCIVSLERIQADQKAINVKIPYIVHKLCSFLESHLNVVGLFRVSGSHKRIASLKEHLRSEFVLLNQNPHDVANVLTQLLRQLKVHLIPKWMNFFIENVVKMDPMKRMKATELCCLLLPSSHLNSLIYICNFLHKVALHSSSNKMPSSSLAAVFAPNLFENNSRELEETRSLINKQQDFLQFLIDNYQIIGIIPSSLRGTVCPVDGCKHKDHWKHSNISSGETCKETANRVHRNKTLAGRLISSVKKKKKTSNIIKARDRSCIKRSLNDSSKEEVSSSARPPKRRSLQGTQDLVINPPSIKVSPSCSKATQSSVNPKPESGTSKTLPVNSFKQFHIGTSYPAANKPSTSKRQKHLVRSLAYPAEDSSRIKRSSFLKKISGSIKSPALKRRSTRKKREKLSQTDNQPSSAKPLTDSFAPNKRLLEITKSEGIRINDSITIFELSTSSVADCPLYPAVPSPILASSNVTREYDSFDCLGIEEAPSLNRSRPIPVGVPAPIASSSFDILHRADSLELLESSQKQEEFFETVLDAKLDGANASRSALENTYHDDSFQKPVDVKALPVSDELPSPKFSPYITSKPNSETDTFGEKTKPLPTFSACDNMNDVCKEVLDDLVAHVSDAVARCGELDSPILRIKPMPPIRKSSRKSLWLQPQSRDVLEDLNEISDEKCSQPNYSDIYKGRCYNSVYRGFPAKPFYDPDQDIGGSSECEAKKPIYSHTPKIPGLKLRGKVSATVKHFDALSASNPHSVKLAPLPYRDIKSRKGSFKMGRPSGTELKLDIPTKLKIAASASPVASSTKTPLSAVKPSLFSNEMMACRNPIFTRRPHRKSKSLDSLADELQEFRDESIPRSPSFPFIGAHPLTPLRVRRGDKPPYIMQDIDFLDSSPAKRLTPNQPRSRSPMKAVTDATFI